ncbi:DUF2332 family protein [Streptomyces noursei]|uniref:DUF2332 family protein n=1 Tax=Streptomyces noursei TaxID=1971 RepID=UPI0039B027FC
MYRRFGEVEAVGTSPLYERVALALSESDEALRAIEAVPARKRHPTMILAALHDLALAGRAPEPAAAYTAADGDAAAGAPRPPAAVGRGAACWRGWQPHEPFPTRLAVRSARSRRSRSPSPPIRPSQGRSGVR